MHVRVGPEGVEDLLTFGVAELVEGELVVVAQEVGPLAGDVELRALPQHLGDRSGIPAGHGEVDVLHPDEVELHVEPVAVGAAEEGLLVLVRHVDLTEQDGVADAAVDEIPYVAEELDGIERVGLSRHVVLGEHEGYGVDPEAGDAELQPEAERA